MAGFIYIMSNKSFKANLIKIGKTERDPSIRKGELYTTGTPDEFHLEYYVFVNNHDELELRIHSELEKYRYSNRREFFECEIEKAIAATRKLCGSSIKFEEIFYKNSAEIEKIKEQEKIERQREIELLNEEAKTKECKKLLEAYRTELIDIVRIEADRNRRIRKARPIVSKIIEAIPTFDKSMRLNIDGEAEDIERSIKQIIENRYVRLVKKYSNTNHRNDQIKLIIDKDIKALKYTLRRKYAEIGGEFSSDYSMIYWGLINSNGKVDGICHIKHEKSSIEEQGHFVNGSREGEFIKKEPTGELKLEVFKNNTIESSIHINIDELDFK
jgi:hypothetical protein